MTQSDSSELDDFLPYLMTQAADALSVEFQKHYKEKYNMLRTEWRVLFHLGSFGSLTAKEICERTHTHKTKVSRAVSALETKGYLLRETMQNDRRQSLMKLSEQGQTVFQDLRNDAQRFNTQIKSQLSAEENRILKKLLVQFIERHPPLPHAADDAR